MMMMMMMMMFSQYPTLTLRISFTMMLSFFIGSLSTPLHFLLKHFQFSLGKKIDVLF